MGKIWGGMEDNQEEMMRKQRCSSSWFPKNQRGGRARVSPSPVLQISPLSLSRGEELQAMHSTGVHFPPCWQFLSTKTLEAWARGDSRRKKDSSCIQDVFPWLGSAGCSRGASTAAGDSPALQQTPRCHHLPANTSHEIQSNPGCYATAGPPGQHRGVFEGNLSMQ